jgi:hypothetical protein
VAAGSTDVEVGGGVEGEGGAEGVGGAAGAAGVAGGGDGGGEVMGLSQCSQCIALDLGVDTRHGALLSDTLARWRAGSPECCHFFNTHTQTCPHPLSLSLSLSHTHTHTHTHEVESGGEKEGERETHNHTTKHTLFFCVVVAVSRCEH